jgi:hypothetical protein
MANEQNLIPFNKRSKEDAKRIQRMGADAMHEKKRKRKLFREYLEDAVGTEVTDSNGNKYTTLEVMVKKTIQKAVNELDLPTIKFIVEMLGESPTQKVDVTSDGKTLAPYEGLSKAEIIKRINQLQTNRKKK